MDIFKKLKSGQPISIHDKEFIPVIEQMNKSREICFQLNH